MNHEDFLEELNEMLVNYKTRSMPNVHKADGKMDKQRHAEILKRQRSDGEYSKCIMLSDSQIHGESSVANAGYAAVPKSESYINNRPMAAGAKAQAARNDAVPQKASGRVKIPTIQNGNLNIMWSDNGLNPDNVKNKIRALKIWLLENKSKFNPNVAGKIDCTLDVSNNKMGDASLVSLLDNLGQQNIAIRVLKCCGMDLADNFSAGLIMYMKRSSSASPIREIDLSHNKLTTLYLKRIIAVAAESGFYPTSVGGDRKTPLRLRIDHNPTTRLDSVYDWAASKGYRICFDSVDGPCRHNPMCMIAMHLPSFCSPSNPGTPKAGNGLTTSRVVESVTPKDFGSETPKAMGMKGAKKGPDIQLRQGYKGVPKSPMSPVAAASTEGSKKGTGEKRQRNDGEYSKRTMLPDIQRNGESRVANPDYPAKRRRIDANYTKFNKPPVTETQDKSRVTSPGHHDTVERNMRRPSFLRRTEYFGERRRNCGFRTRLSCKNFGLRRSAASTKCASGDPQVNAPLYAPSKFGKSRSNYQQDRDTVYQNVVEQARGCERFDPSRNPDAFADAQAKGLTKWANVKNLQVSHSSVSETFRHGEHKGVTLEQTLDRLKRGVECTTKFTPVVLIRDGGSTWAVFGNRRVTVAKEYQQYLEKCGNLKPVWVQAIEYEKDNAPHQINAKYMLAKTGNGQMPQKR